jgi:hypothetical protein
MDLSQRDIILSKYKGIDASKYVSNPLLTFVGAFAKKTFILFTIRAVEFYINIRKNLHSDQ